MEVKGFEPAGSLSQVSYTETPTKTTENGSRWFVLTNCEYAVKFRCNRKQDARMSDRKQIKDYPDQTPGSKLAAKVRQKANSLSDEQRGDSFKRGLALIYGGAPAKKAVSTRH